MSTDGKKCVLVVSTSGNTHADAIEKQVLADGHSAIRVNADELFRGQLSMEASGGRMVLFGEGTSLQGIDAAFYHHPRFELDESVGVDAFNRELVASGWRNAIATIEHLWSGATWVNKPAACRESASVFRQLDAARAAGLQVPPTLFTNDKEAVQRFFQHGSRVVIKSGPLIGVRRDTALRVLATALHPDDIDRDSLRVSPCVFQPLIEKAYELRIHATATTCLACRIESQASASAETRVDWRHYSLKDTPHYPHLLDSDLAAAFSKLVRSLGLLFGIIDVVVDRSGTFWFLECSSQGHWLWVERLTGLPITKLIVDTLLARKTAKTQ